MDVPREVRKTVTVLFCDVVGSTGLGERLDAEALRHVLSRYFDEMRGALERHGGTVEKFIGDAVMAVFGVPAVHEDDALRAALAAVEMRERLARLNDELERDHGVRVQVRIGINTGEVVAGGDPGASLVTGDAVNVASRLEHTAAAGEIVVGDATRELLGPAATVEALGAVQVRGKAAPVHAWRLAALAPGAPVVRSDTPFVGRHGELARLRESYWASVREHSCRLLTVVGAAGVGKSRLACELFDELGDAATILTGRCLPYGDGITFWPVTQIVREAGGDDALARALEGEEDAELVLERLCGLTGRAPAAGAEEGFWALRRVCEALARDRPLVICVEDIHWAESTLLDLIEYLAGWTRERPILLLCLARPELLDVRPTWVRNPATWMALEPLPAADSRELVRALGIDGEPGARLAAAADGNPLFAEQLAAMLDEDGRLDDIPPTIQALLGARLDRLPAAERDVIQRAAIAGKDFWRASVADLSPPNERRELGAILLSLVRKDLIRPRILPHERDDAFRFAHVLVREAAYAATPKEARAELHARFAAWLERAPHDEPEREELLGYHLEQAYRYRAELRRIDDEALALRRRAGTLLASAGRRAIGRDDAPAAVKLLQRAVPLLDDDAAAGLLPDLGAALASTGALAQANEVLATAIERARALSHRQLEATALIERSLVKLYAEAEPEGLGRVAEQVIPIFAHEGDDLGLSRAWHLLGLEHAVHGQFTAMERALDRAVEYARRAGDKRQERRAIGHGAFAAAMGPTPVGDAIRRCQAIRERTAAEPSLQAIAIGNHAELEAMRGRFDEARRLCAEARSILEERGRMVALAGVVLYAAPVEVLAGRPDEAERLLRRGYDRLRSLGERGALAIVEAFLARVLVANDRLEEAERFAELARTTASPSAVLVQVVWREARARVLAAKGASGEAAGLASEAVALARSTDAPNMLADALVAFSDVRRPTATSDAWSLPLREAIELYRAKDNTVSAAWAGARLQPALSRP